jgi:hypothetical protein
MSQENVDTLLSSYEWFRAKWGSAWDQWEVEIEALHDVGDKVLAIVKQRGRSKLAGIPAEIRMGTLWTFRDGN